MEKLRSEIFSRLTEETRASTLLRLYSTSSFFPVTTEKRLSTPLTKINTCSHCEERMVSLFCRADDMLTCKPCKFEYHVRCHVEKIAHASRGVLDSSELVDISKRLTTLKCVFQKLKENKRLKKLQHRQQKMSMLKLSHRWKMLQSTRRAFDSVIGTGMEKYQEDLEQYEQTLARKSQWVVQQIMEYLDTLTTCVQEDNEVCAFIVIHRAKNNLKDFFDVLNEITADHKQADIYDDLKSMVNGIYFCEGQGSVFISRILKTSKAQNGEHHFRLGRKAQTPTERSKSTKSFGTSRRSSRSRDRVPSGRRRFFPAFKPQTIRMATMVSSLRSERSSRDPTKASIVLRNLVADEPPKSFGVGETDRCNISAIKSLHDGKMMLLDCRNNKIKLFSIQDKLVAEKKLDCSVWDFTMISKKDALVTCPVEGNLLPVKIAKVLDSHSLVPAGHIITQKECRAICSVKNRIFISFNGPSPCIKILSKDGIMFRSIDGIRGEKTLFKNPLNILVSKLGKIIWISDFSMQRIVKVDQKGTLLGTYDLRTGWPLGMGSDRDGNVVVAVSGCADIKIITKGSSKAKTLVGPRILEGEPCNVAVKETVEGKRLYVAYADNCVIKVFRMY